MRAHQKLTVLLLAAGFASFALADERYDFTVNTASIEGVVGALDFNFNPGPLVTQAAYFRLQRFSGDGSPTGSPSLFGNVSGTLPGTVIFDNSAGFNDYFQGYAFGSVLSFQVDLYGPAIASPDGLPGSGSTLSFSMYSDADGTVPALTTHADDGFAVQVDVNSDGSTTISDFSVQTTVTPVISSVPEPDSIYFLAVALLWCALRSALHARRLYRAGASTARN